MPMRVRRSVTNQEGFFGAFAPHDAVHLPMAKAAPSFDLLGAGFNAFSVGAPGGLPFAVCGIMTAAFIVQVVRCELEENISPVDVIIKRVFTYHGVIDFSVVSDLRQGGPGAKPWAMTSSSSLRARAWSLPILRSWPFSFRNSLYLRSATSGQYTSINS